MHAHPGSGEELDWRSAVTVREDAELTTELGHRLELSSGLRSIGVTDLLAPRQAFWRLTAPPIPVSPARQERLESGRRVHRVVGALFAAEGSLEVRVRRQGLVGRIDVLTDRPIELKTATLATGPDDLLRDRPDHAEQLAMYCALMGRTTGRLITIVPHGEREAETHTLDLRFGDLTLVFAEMQRRAAALRSALEEGRPSRLPRCRWFERGCEFLGGPTCDCMGGEPETTSEILGEVSEVAAQPAVDQWLGPRLAKALRAVRVPTVGRFRDMVYPRRTFFERTHPGMPAEGPIPARSATASELYGRLVEALEGGPVGEVARLPSLADDPEEEVAAFRGTPYLARTSRSWSPVAAEGLVAQSPQYPLELGFRCAATGTTVARVIVAYERATLPRDRLRVFELRFAPVTTFARVWRARTTALDRALKSKAPHTLAACPRWMYDDCPYRTECGCGDDPGRSQR